METWIKTYPRPDGEHQRVQCVRMDDWQQLDFLRPKGGNSLDAFYEVYRRELVPTCPWVFGNLVLFSLPEAARPADDARETPLAAAANCLNRGVKLIGGKPRFLTAQAKALWEHLQRHDCLRLVRGKLPTTRFLPVGEDTGYLTREAPDALVKANASFFIMDPFDCATAYDAIGTPVGLQVKDGVVESPPLFQREALLVGKDGRVWVSKPDLRDLTVEVGGREYRDGYTAFFYSRPQYKRTPPVSREQLVIVGRRVAAICKTGSIPVPASGFVITGGDFSKVRVGDLVTYHGMESVAFGIQVGNSILRDGVPTDRFLSPFYNLRRLQRVPYPPCLYPMNFHKSRAPRMALGADAEGRPMLAWAEGAAKRGHVPGQDSCGATLADMADICRDFGMVNAINLDGGGSAQLLVKGIRSLLVSGRTPELTEAERPIPLGLFYKG